MAKADTPSHKHQEMSSALHERELGRRNKQRRAEYLENAGLKGLIIWVRHVVVQVSRQHTVLVCQADFDESCVTHTTTSSPTTCRTKSAVPRCLHACRQCMSALVSGALNHRMVLGEAARGPPSYTLETGD